jgi:hypothetical protein
MIAVRLEGRLGNQLFQYAFIYAAAKKLNTSFYLDKGVENFLLPKYFEIKNDFLAPLDNKVFAIQGYKNIFRIHAKKVFYNFLSALLFRGKRITINNEMQIEDASIQLKNHHIYFGFFHSESYFQNAKDEIRALLKIRKKYADEFEKLQGRIGSSKKKTVIHIRRTDYVNLDLSLPVTYYKKAIDLIGKADMQYIFISDDPSYIEQQFSDLNDRYISTQSEIIDLQFLMNADYCVLSCSSFSWWGAWLNTNKNKQVFGPKNWLGFKEGKEYPTSVANNIDVTWIEV